MDELALLKDFRLEDAATDGAREHARATLQTAMNRRRLSRRYVIALAFAVAALLAAGAYAIVHEFVIGAPAPKGVNAQIKLDVGYFFDSDLIPWRSHPRNTAGPTLVAAAAETPQGPVYLLLTPLQGGGECLFTYTGREDGPPPPSTCNLHRPLQPDRFVYSTENITNAGLMIVGYAPGAVRLRYGGDDFQTPLGWFVVPSRVDNVLTAYGVHDGVVARVRLGFASRPTSQPQPKPTPHPVLPRPTGPSRVIASTQTGWAVEIHRGAASRWFRTNDRLRIAVAPAAGSGRRCIYAYVTDPTVFGYECTWHRPGTTELQVRPQSVGWTLESRPHWVTVLVLIGQVGSDIARVTVRFSDGSSAPMALRQGVIFYHVTRRHFAAGRRPTEIVARDASGHIVARKRLPFVR
jgi:hypothetical protein